MKDLNNLNSVMVPKPGYGTYDISQVHTTSGSFGNLMPFFMIEGVAGDTITLGNETLTRLQPLAAPVMQQMQLKIHYFAVPYRLLWENYEYFITNRPDPLTGQPPIVPTFPARYIDIDPVTSQTRPMTASYFGHRPQAQNDNYQFNAFPFAAYQLICDTWYKHKGLILNEYDYKLDDGEMTVQKFNRLATMRKITFEDDYFSLMLPTPQAYNPSFINDAAPILNSEGGSIQIPITGGGNITIPGAIPSDPVSTQLFAEVQITIEELRRAASMQTYLELIRHATTYRDYMRSVHDSDIEDYRIQLPEYITGFTTPIQVSDVMNTDSKQGKLTGNAATYGNAERRKYYCKEHCIIMGIAAVTYKPVYPNALNRLWFKKSSFDFLNPMFEQIGERAVYRGELIPDSLDKEQTLGYLPQYAEYKTNYDIVTREFANYQAHWTLARQLDGNVVLSEDFNDVVDNRTIFQFQDQSNDTMLFQFYTSAIANRRIGQKMPLLSQ